MRVLEERRGVEAETLKVIAICFVLLLIFLFFTTRLGLFGSAQAQEKQCSASIAAMHKLPLPMATSEGIRCKTAAVSLDPKGGKSIQQVLAREMAHCADTYGRFRYDPFHGTHADNTCLICSVVAAKDTEEFRDVDVALLTETKQQQNAYTILTGRTATENLRQALLGTPDVFQSKEFAVVWLRSGRSSAAQWLQDWGMQQKDVLWQANLLELIPGQSVDGSTDAIIGAGRGIFAPDGEGLGQAVLLLSKDAAARHGCVTLDGEPYKPPV